MKFSLCGEVVFHSVLAIAGKKVRLTNDFFRKKNCPNMRLGSSATLSSNFGGLYGSYLRHYGLGHPLRSKSPPSL